MEKYDDASWHYEGDFPKNLPIENAATHIGMFITWCIENNLLSEEQTLDFEEDISEVKKYKMTGSEYLINNCDEKFIEDDLCELGNNFTKDYYNNNSLFADKYGTYFTDYCNIFDENAEKNGFEYESLYHVENTWKNYQLIKVIIDKRFEEWKKFTKFKS